MATPTRRQRLANVASPAELDRYARSIGFPSAHALNRVIQLGAHLKAGGRITGEWINKMAQVYPAVPRRDLESYARSISTVDDLARVVGVDPAAAHQYVDSYSTATTQQSLTDRMEARDAARGAPKVEQKPADTDSLRAHLLHAYGKHRSDVDLNDLPPRERRNQIAAGLERNVQKSLARLASGEKDLQAKGDRYVHERSLHGDVEAAFDTVALRETAEEELSTDDLEGAMDHENDLPVLPQT